ncbi:unnamed protein product [Effrenium voratum]|nr:unnamed protein product [Effrenium voratum]
MFGLAVVTAVGDEEVMTTERFAEWLEVSKLQIDVCGKVLELCEAAGNGNLADFSRLLEEPRDPSVRGIDGSPPLHLAASNGHVEVIHCLLEVGVDKDDRDTLYGGAPLHYATLGGHLDAVHCLLAAGADRGLFTCEGWAPLHLAAGGGHEEALPASKCG